MVKNCTDQNEKLAMYGATHVIAVDGFSRKVVRCITVPVKNPIAIYDLLFSARRHLGLSEGSSWHRIFPHFSGTKSFSKIENKAGPSSLHADNIN